MKNIKFLILLAASVAVIALAGCVSKDPGTGVNGIPPHYSVDTNSLNQAHLAADGIGAATAPINPYAVFVPSATNIGFGLAALISGLIATVMNKKAGTASATADSLAEAAVKNGTAKAALEHASDGPVFKEVADKINNATPNNSPLIT